MCGIAGIIQTRTGGPAPDARIARRMTDALVHRGPDDGDVHAAGPVALGHRRLSIIDVAAGHQPMFNEDGSVCVVFNGEIYNFAEVADELKKAGHVFRTRSDTEVIVHGWEQWGERCIERFRGMFAFVLWDARQRVAFLARDRLGVKPLHWALLPDGQLLFGSELKALMAHPALAREVDPCAVEDYFALGYVPDPKTIYKAARKLPAAHTLTVTVGRPLPAPARYWRPVYEPKSGLTEAAALEELDALLDESVRLRMIADVPLGAFLSGGVDSSLVVAKMSGMTPEPVQTFSIGFDEPQYDETRYARLVAERWRTDHHVRMVSMDDLAIVDQVLAAYDEPFADSSALATWRVSQAARERVTVALSGDGGDEAFGGYRRYRLHVAEEAVRRRLPEGLRRIVFGAAGHLYPKADWLPRPLRAKTTLQSLSRSSVQAYGRSMSAVPAHLRAALYTPQFRRELGGYDASQVFEDAARGFEGGDPLDLLQHIDLQTWLSGDINTKVDRASMAHSLEVRDPLLDHRLIEWAARLPQHWKTTPTQGKIVLRRAVEKLVPREALDRPKQGFSIPVDRWFRGPLRATLTARLDNAGSALSQVLQPGAVRDLLDAHASGRSNHDRALWSIHAFARFAAHSRPELVQQTPCLAGAV